MVSCKHSLQGVCTFLNFSGAKNRDCNWSVSLNGIGCHNKKRHYFPENDCQPSTVKVTIIKNSRFAYPILRMSFAACVTFTCIKAF